MTRTLRPCSADQCVKPWQTCCAPASGALWAYFSAKRACPDSCPATKRLALQGVSLSTRRLKSSTSVTLALAGIVAHSVTGLASASVQARVAGVAASADTPGGVLVPGGVTTTAGRQAATA